jgi:hypothetical protein
MERRIAVVALSFGSLIFAAGVAAHDEHPPLRTVSVSGEGEVAVKPDRARLVMYVDKLAPEVKTGEAEVNKVVRAYLAEAKSLGAKEEHLSTTGVSIQPEYVWDEKSRQQKLAGYRVRREIALLVNNLDHLGDFILGATKAGVNQINPPVLESSKSGEIERQALVKAAEAAKSKALLLAETLNAKLGPVRRISANDANPPPPIPMKAMAMRAESAGANAEMGISLGEIRYRAEVSAEFDLLPQ